MISAARKLAAVRRTRTQTVNRREQTLEAKRKAIVYDLSTLHPPSLVYFKFCHRISAFVLSTVKSDVLLPLFSYGTYVSDNQRWSDFHRDSISTGDHQHCLSFANIDVCVSMRKLHHSTLQVNHQSLISYQK